MGSTWGLMGWHGGEGGRERESERERDAAVFNMARGQASGPERAVSIIGGVAPRGRRARGVERMVRARDCGSLRLAAPPFLYLWPGDTDGFLTHTSFHA